MLCSMKMAKHLKLKNPREVKYMSLNPLLSICFSAKKAQASGGSLFSVRQTFSPSLLVFYDATPTLRVCVNFLKRPCAWSSKLAHLVVRREACVGQPRLVACCASLRAAAPCRGVQSGRRRRFALEARADSDTERAPAPVRPVERGVRPGVR